MKRFLILWCLLAAGTLYAQRGEFTLKIVDSKTKEPLDCRVEVRNERGVSQRVEKLPFLYDHLAVPGRVEMAFPLGTYPMVVERGLEYLPRTGHFVLNRSAKDEKTETLHRFIDLSRQGWWSADLEVLRKKSDIEALMKADDVHFVPLLGPKKQGTEAIPEVWFDGDRVYTTGNYRLTHPDCGVSLLNLPAGTDWTGLKLEEQSTPIPFLYLLRKKDASMWLDVTNSESWDLPLLVSLGMVDSMRILGKEITRSQVLPPDFDWTSVPPRKSSGKLNAKKRVKKKEGGKTPSEVLAGETMRYRGDLGYQRWTEDVYFHLLNVGLRIPPSAGSGSGLSPNPVGSNRVYAFVDRSEYLANADVSGLKEKGGNAGFNTAMWWDALRSGAAVVTNGPLLVPRVDGCLPGFFFEFTEAETPIKLEIGLTLSTRSSIQYIEILVNGKVQQSIRFQDYAETGKLPPITLEESGWFLLRVVTDVSGTYCCGMTAPFYVQIGDQPNPQAKESATFFLNWEKARIRMLKKSGAFEGETGAQRLQFHEHALKYWLRKSR
ncbi:MAG: hypothetical protein Q4D98_03315 [Planctomycetia bacterium]|nr:hypothetical protein [Planctomycetia bacterium]